MPSKAIAVAAGGGGDVVSASVLAAKLRHRFDVVAVMSYSWDRLIVDPIPGPRCVDDFDGLVRHHDLVAEVTEATRLRGAGWSTLPPLVPYLAHPLLLVDPTNGALGVAAQFRAASRIFDAEALILVDIGGDILAEGHEDGLRSPLADSLMLAAATQADLALHLLVAGIGLDGELTRDELRALLRRHDAVEAAQLGKEDVSAAADVWAWHPSEANGLLCVAAGGWRGTVETQRGALVRVDDEAGTVHEVDTDSVATNSLAAVLADTVSLDQAEQRIRDRRGYSDIDTERDRLSTGLGNRTPTTAVLRKIDRYALSASLRGVDALTIRRVFELTGAIGAHAGDTVRDLLGRERPRNMQPPLYLTRGHLNRTAREPDENADLSTGF
ncbi:DUF1152 domain-containing protein [Nocardia cyriacigeorgica]|uniref:DUF1152 domain-containing protein n=1 Tax=Nocardia cyriacigeorgica TaxID=135487 RepID=UPI0034DB4AB9